MCHTSGVLFLYAGITFCKFYFSNSKEPLETRIIKLLRKLSLLQNQQISQYQTRSTQRAQTSLAEADHYSHIAHCKMLSLGCGRLPTPLKKKKKKKKGSGSLPSPRSGYATTITVYFCSFTHLTIPRSPPKFNQFFLVLLRTRP